MRLSTVRCVGIVGKHQGKDHIEAVRSVISYCQARGLSVQVEPQTAESVGLLHLAACYENMASKIELMIVVGGDGLMLSAARQVALHQVPLLGINRGRLGFLTLVESVTLVDELDALFESECRTETRTLIEANVFREGQAVYDLPVALNDIYLSRGGSGRLMEFDLRVDSAFVYRQRADGIIVSTPTGSTAYALSANGPIVHPSVPALLLVPLCPHSLSCRPVAVSDASKIECHLLDAPDAYLHIDGQIQVPVTAGDTICVAKSEHAVTLILPEDYQFFAILRQKLRWSESPTAGTVS